MTIEEEREEIARLIDVWFLPWQASGEDNGLQALAQEVRARTCLERGHTRNGSSTRMGSQDVFICGYCKQELYVPAMGEKNGAA